MLEPTGTQDTELDVAKSDEIESSWNDLKFRIMPSESRGKINHELTEAKKVEGECADYAEKFKDIGVIKLTEAKKAEVECADCVVNLKDDGEINVDQSRDKAKTKQQENTDTDQRTATTSADKGLSDPVVYEKAATYVASIKQRYSSKPEVYRRFIDVLATYERGELRVTEVWQEINVLFPDQPDLLKE